MCVGHATGTAAGLAAPFSPPGMLDIPKTPFSVQYVTVDAFVAGISDNVI